MELNISEDCLCNLTKCILLSYWQQVSKKPLVSPSSHFKICILKLNFKFRISFAALPEKKQAQVSCSFETILAGISSLTKTTSWSFSNIAVFLYKYLLQWEQWSMKDASQKHTKLNSQISHLSNACQINRKSFVQQQNLNLCFPMCKKQQHSFCRQDANAFFLPVSLKQKCARQDSDKWQYSWKQQDHQVLTTSVQGGQALWSTNSQDLHLSLFLHPMSEACTAKEFSAALWPL